MKRSAESKTARRSYPRAWLHEWLLLTGTARSVGRIAVRLYGGLQKRLREWSHYWNRNSLHGWPHSWQKHAGNAPLDAELDAGPQLELTEALRKNENEKVP